MGVNSDPAPTPITSYDPKYHRKQKYSRKGTTPLYETRQLVLQFLYGDWRLCTKPAKGHREKKLSVVRVSE